MRAAGSSEQRRNLPFHAKGYWFWILLPNLTVIFSIAGDAPARVQSVTIDGIEMEFRRDHILYRPGGVRIPRAEVYPLLTDGTNRMRVSLAKGTPAETADITGLDLPQA